MPVTPHLNGGESGMVLANGAEVSCTGDENEVGFRLELY